MGQRFWVVLLTVALAGCGGGGGSPSSPPVGGGGSLRGELGPDAAGAVVRVEGTAQVTWADAAGNFAFEGVPPGEYTVSAVRPDGFGGAVLVHVTPGQSTVVPPIPFQGVGQIAGLVTTRDGAVRRPVAGARVTAWLISAEPPPFPVADGVLEGVASAGAPSRQETEPVAPRVQTAVTDADGAFRFVAVPPGAYSLSAAADGYEQGYGGTYVLAGQTAPADLELIALDPRNASLSGAVTTGLNGATVPLSRVRVTLWPLDDVPGPLPAEGVVSSPPDYSDPSAPWMLPPYRYGYEAFSDEQGGYRIRNIRPGRYTLSFHRYGYTTGSREIALGETEAAAVDVLLEYLLTTITGTVRGLTGNGSVPLVGASVFGGGPVPLATPTEGQTPAIWPIEPVPGGQAVTDAAGRYRLEVMPGPIWLDAWAEGYQPAHRQMTVPSGGLAGVEFLLTPGQNGGGVSPPGGPGQTVPD